MEPSYQSKTLSEWIVDLKHGDVAERCAAALALAEIGPEKQPVMNALVNGVLDPDKAVQVACAIAIGFVPMDAQTRRNMFHDLTSADPKLRQGWVEILRWSQGSGNAPAAPAAPEVGIQSSESVERKSWDESPDEIPDIRLPSRTHKQSGEGLPATMKPYVFAIRHLDDDVRSYLASISRDADSRRSGVFIERTTLGGWIDLVPALFLIALTLGSAWVARYFTPGGVQFFFIAQLALAVLSFVVMVHVVRKIRARNNGLGSFLFADRRYLWDVDPMTVKMLPLAGVTGARGEWISHVGDRQRVILDNFGRDQTLGIFDVVAAENLVAFLRDLGARNSALQQADDEDDIPRPAPPTWGQHARRWLPAMASVAAGILFAAGALIPANGFMREEYLHSHVQFAAETDAGPHLRYLAEYPTGRYTAEVQSQMLATRIAEAKHVRNPEPLWRFNSECKDTELNKKARTEIQRIYDQKATEYAKLATEAKGNKQLVEGFASLLRELGSSDLPRRHAAPEVPVVFRGSHVIQPVDQVPKFMEELARMDLKNGILKSPPDQLFNANETVQREKMLLDRFNRALGMEVSPKFFTLISQPSAKPPIEVVYRIHPAGDFFTFRETQTGVVPPLKKNPWDPLGLPNFNPFPRPDPIWLVRQYNIDWTITIAPPNMERRFSASGKVLNTRKNVRWTTKDWTDSKRDPYMYIMDIMMHDLSDQMVTNLGLPPQARPQIDAKKN